MTAAKKPARKPANKPAKKLASKPAARPTKQPTSAPPVTPDGRYLVVRGRLWRRTNPDLPEPERAALVAELMAARRAVQLAREAGDADALRAAGERVDAAKIGLGERGPVWWTDGAPDLNRHLARTTPYAQWYAALTATPPPARAARTRRAR